MDQTHIKELLRKVKGGTLSVEQAVQELRHFPYQDLGFAKVDHHRSLRKGFPEVIFCQGKTPTEILAITHGILHHGKNLLATRADPDVFEKVHECFPKAVYHERSRVITIQAKPISKKGLVLVLSAGTSDIPVAEEAAITAEMLGNRVQRIYDVGVAGIHRLFDRMKELDQARVLIVVAGMEGALPSVVAGLVNRLVIAVPTSVGYGASFGGVAALLAMLNSCASGVTVMNIDNGFGAGFAASLVNKGSRV